jgi:hypothetical protein
MQLHDQQDGDASQNVDPYVAILHAIPGQITLTKT